MNEALPPAHGDLDEALLEQLLRDEGLSDGADRIPARAANRLPAASFAQERIWFLCQWPEQNISYNIPAAFRIQGPLDVRALQQAFQDLVQRHETLRTAFALSEERLVQVIAPETRATVPLHDLAAGSPDMRAEQVREWQLLEQRTPFDLAQGPMVRACLLRLQPDEHVFLITLHHIVADAWSVDILVRELSLLYEAAHLGRSAPLPVLSTPYADYAAWQRERMRGPWADREIGYWKERLRGLQEPYALPSAGPQVGERPAWGVKHEWTLPPDLAHRVRTLARKSNATLFMVMLSALAPWMARVCGKNEAVLGAPFSGRTRKETQDLVGFFVNTVVLRQPVDGAWTFAQMLDQVRQTTVEAMDHQELPFESLVESLKPSHAPGTTPFFQVFYNVLSVPETIGLTGLSITPLDMPDVQCRFDLTVYVQDQQHGLAIHWVYAPDRFQPDTVMRWSREFAACLDEWVRHPDRPLREGLPAPQPISGLPAAPGLYDGAVTSPEPLVSEWAIRLLGSPQILEATILPRTDSQGQPVWAVYAVAQSGIPLPTLEAEVADCLRGCPHPYVLIPVASLPLNAEGVVDHAVLRSIPVVDDTVRNAWRQALLATGYVGPLDIRAAALECGVERIHRSRLLNRSPLDIETGARRFLPQPFSPVKSAELPVSLHVSASSNSNAGNIEGAPGAMRESGLSRRGCAVESLGEILIRAARQSPDHGVIHITRQGDVFESYPSLLERAGRIAGALQAQGVMPGEIVILQCAHNDQFLAALWGCFLGAYLPLPLAVPPVYDAENAEAQKLQWAWARLNQPRVLTPEDRLETVRAFLTADATAPSRILNLDACLAHAAHVPEPMSQGDQPALLLATSGSTAEPKLVTLTHRNLLANLDASAQFNRLTSDDRSLNWLKLDHVGGLVRCSLRDIFVGSTQIHAEPELFLERPTAWLEWIGRLSVTQAWLPNFAMALLAQQEAEIRSGPWRLAGLKSLLSVAEPIVKSTAQRLQRLLAPHGLGPGVMQAAWGMSETGAAVVFSSTYLDQPETATGAVEVGAPISGLSLRIVDESDHARAEGEIGYIHIKGAMVTVGYWADQEATRQAFTDDGWFRTGDTGYLRNGRLTVTGRSKDVIIVNGQNRSCQEIEAQLQSMAGIKASALCVCAIRRPADDTDRIAVFFDPESDQAESLLAISALIRERMNRRFGVGAEWLIPLPRSAWPLTASGKVRRAEFKRLLESGAYDGIIESTDLLLANERTVPAWFYERAWQRSDYIREVAPDNSARVLIVADAAGLGPALEARLKGRGRACDYVPASDASRDRAGWLAVLQSCGCQTRPFTHILHAGEYLKIEDDIDGRALCLDTILSSSCPRPVAGPHERSALRFVHSWVALVQALEQAQGSRPVRLLVVMSHSQAVHPTDRVAPDRAACLGLFRTIPLDVPWLDARHLDLEMTGVDDAADCAIRELYHAKKEREVAYRSGCRLIPRLRPLPLGAPLPADSARHQDRSSDVDLMPGPDDLVLITGGLGEIGVEVARMLLATQQTNIVLAGRSAPDVGPESGRRLQALADLSALPGRVRYVTLDVADDRAVESAVSHWEREWQCRLRWVLHLARETVEGPLLGLRPADLDTAGRAKIQGALSIRRLMQSRPSCRAVCFSSLSGLLGAPGLSAYAVAGAWLDAWAWHEQRAGAGAGAGGGAGRWMTIDWGIWAELGSHRDYQMRTLSEQQGFVPIRTREGLDSLCALLHHPMPQVAVGLNGRARFMRRLARSHPYQDYELTVQAHSLEDGHRLGAWVQQVEVMDRFGVPVPCRAVISQAADGLRAASRTALAGPVPGSARDLSVLQLQLARIWSDLLRVAGPLDRDSNFFALGGHSLLTLQLISRLRESLGLDVPLRVVFDQPTLGGLSEWIEAHRSSASSPGGEALPLRPCPPSDWALSFAQERLWFLDRLEPGKTVYNLSSGLRLQGCLNVQALRDAFSSIVRRHAVLRTVFDCQAGQPVPRVQPPAPVSLEVLDCPGLDESARQARIRAAFQADAEVAFDLRVGPLYRLSLLRFNAQDHALVTTLHHIVSDGWSSGVLARELSAGYQAAVAGGLPDLPALAIQYGDFAVWQRHLIDGAEGRRQGDYWQQRLANAAPVLELPTDHPRPLVPSYRGGLATIDIPPALTERLKALAGAREDTLFMTCLAALQALFYRYTGQTNVSVGTPVANRGRKELEPLIGFLVNTLVINVDLDGALPFSGLLQRVKESCLGAYAHADLPFEQVVDRVRPARDRSHAPLFQVMFAFQNTPSPDLNLPGLRATPVYPERGSGMFDLTWSLNEQAAGLKGIVDYNVDVFEAATVERMIRHYLAILESASAQPELPMSDLPLQSPEEFSQWLGWSRGPQVERAPKAEPTLHGMVEAAARAWPQRDAVRFKDQSLTYAELDRQADAVAMALNAQGVGPDDRVGLFLDRSLLMPMAMLGVLKSGAAYVPIDVRHPRDRAEWMLRDAGVKMLLTASPHMQAVEALAWPCAQVLRVDAPERLTCPTAVRPCVSPENLAYVIYTSGSTGRPKGVMVPHRAICNLIRYKTRTFQVTHESRMLQFVAAGFDVATSDVFMALSTGALLCLCDEEASRGGVPLTRMIQDWRLTHAPIPSPVLATLPYIPLPDLKVVMIGGEVCPVDAVRRWAEGRVLFNEYGPTETTVCSTVEAFDPAQGDLALGRPIDNTVVYILGPDGRPAPIGVPGEMFIGGAGVARGYLNRPDLTAQRFVPDTVGHGPGLLYRTGDKARWTRQGRIEFLGRIDLQVKIRGFRIEPAEIEAVCKECPEVADCAVHVYPGPAGAPTLAAYVVRSGLRPGPGLDSGVPGGSWVDMLRTFLRTRLPDYMMPAAFVSLPEIPRLLNGKVNRQALPLPEPESKPSAGRGACDETEEKLVGIWQQFLSRDTVGVTDSFFDWGGNSLLAVRLVAQMESEFNCTLSLAAFFDQPTIAGVAQRLRTGAAEPVGAAVVLNASGPGIPWFCAPGAGGSPWYLRDLARRFEGLRPVYGFQSLDRPQGLSGVKTLAVVYAQAVKQHRHEGPCLLGGHSFGAWVAWEAACQLRAQGYPVAGLVMVDAVAPFKWSRQDVAEKSDVDWLMEWVAVLEDMCGASLALSRDEVERLNPEDRLRRLHQQLVKIGYLPEGAGYAMIQRILDAFKADQQMEYEPESRQPIPVLLVRTVAEGSLAQMHPEWRAWKQSVDWGWSSCSSVPVTVETVPGTHLTLIREPYVVKVAEVIERFCNQSCPRPGSGAPRLQ